MDYFTNTNIKNNNNNNNFTYDLQPTMPVPIKDVPVTARGVCALLFFRIPLPMRGAGRTAS
jgi:hypothetical protein